ncbi:MAG: hypothetical protein JO326_09360 [Acetobacteraceae bacterium]|nr:hypothetical protein [Acetobacteraceae bacterium]
MTLVAIPALAQLRDLLSPAERRTTVGLWLLHPAAAEERCETPPNSRAALLQYPYAPLALYLARHSRPDERILVGLDRTDRIFINAMALYWAADRLPASAWSHYDPGLQTRADIQDRMIADLRDRDVRWVVRDGTYRLTREPNKSAISSGVNLLDDYIDRNYRPVAAAGAARIWLRAGEPVELLPPVACEAAPVR